MARSSSLRSSGQSVPSCECHYTSSSIGNKLFSLNLTRKHCQRGPIILRSMPLTTFVTSFLPFVFHLGSLYARCRKTALRVMPPSLTSMVV
ncbi:hypothetical protein LY76DRAFT_178991 [Colletotrichum caudatum]|nr:hypothetical protein LY76DRAFT_178991 [Colletotrichum caudatum]